MFFIVNASDLAENKNDLNMVLDYVKSQLLELGIRFPKVYPVSSKLSLEEKENGLSLNKEMSHFENKFYQFIEQDLAQLTIDSRSEEHTSELQSRGHLVCRLLLEKKK